MSNVSEDLKAIIFAALFHDVGKFAQRTGIKFDNWDNFDTFCPNGRVHAYYTYRIMKDDSVVKTLYPEYLRKEKDNISNLAGKHHNPKYENEWIIAEADRISAGADRTQNELNTDKDKDKFNKGNYQTTPLESIFSKIRIKNNKNQAKVIKYDLKELKPENFIGKSENFNITSDLYQSHWNNFLSNFKNLKFSNQILKDSIVYDSLLEYYWHCIPSSTIDDPDISLYDHSVTTAAFATILYKYHKETNTFEKKEIINRDNKKFLILSGDVSGIQNYIFDLETSKFNSKILRARSFEIQMICESVVYEILERLELPIFCRIMNGGGRFILILPNLESVRKDLEKIRNELNIYFLKKYAGKLALNISDGIELSAKEMMQDDIDSVIKKHYKISANSKISYAKLLFCRITDDVNRSKSKKLQSALIGDNKYILSEEYDKINSAQDVCSICGYRTIDDEFKNENLCGVCGSLVKLGENLPKYDYYVISKEVKNQLSIQLPFNWYLSLGSKEDIEKIKGIKFKINEFECGCGLAKLPYYLPINENKEVLTFEDLANKSEGNNKIAMFKADLDNLGAVFSKGLDKISISRYASLSRNLNNFFSMYINWTLEKPAKENEDFKNIYTVFSGGDDLCLIGPWDTIIKYSIFIQEKFREFTGYNPDLTISGGIALSNHSLPVRFIADMAEENLEESKNNQDKNSITIFSKTTKWEQFKKMIDLGKEFINKTKSEIVSNSLIYRLIIYSSMNDYCFNYCKNKTIDIKDLNKNILWKSHLDYDVSRNIKDKNEREDFIKKVLENIDTIRIAATYCNYINRKK